MALVDAEYRFRFIVLACVVLHNMLKGERGSSGARVERDLEDENLPCGLGDPVGGHGRNPTNSAKEQRDYLMDWFNSAGAVPWQDDKV